MTAPTPSGDSAEVPEVQSVQDLLDGLELTEVRTYLLHAERGSYEALDEARISVAVNHEDIFVEVRCRLTTTSDDCELAIDRSAVFTLNRPVVIPPPILAEFVEKVGVMTVYPYLREGLFSLAMNLGVAPPVIGLMRAGTVRLTADPNGSADEAR
jgi:hypothetical protein